MPKGYIENTNFSLSPNQRVQRCSSYIGLCNVLPFNLEEPQPRSETLCKTERIKMKMHLIASWFSRKNHTTTDPFSQEHKPERKHHLRFWKNWGPSEITIAPVPPVSDSLSYDSSDESCFSSNDCVSSPLTFPESQSELEDSFDDTCTVLYKPIASNLEMYSMIQLPDELNTEISDMQLPSTFNTVPQNIYVLERPKLRGNCSTDSDLAGLMSTGFFNAPVEFRDNAVYNTKL